MSPSLPGKKVCAPSATPRSSVGSVVEWTSSSSSGGERFGDENRYHHRCKKKGVIGDEHSVCSSCIVMTADSQSRSALAPRADTNSQQQQKVSIPAPDRPPKGKRPPKPANAELLTGSGSTNASGAAVGNSRLIAVGTPPRGPPPPPQNNRGSPKRTNSAGRVAAGSSTTGSNMSASGRSDAGRSYADSVGSDAVVVVTTTNDMAPASGMWRSGPDPQAQEQALFEQRLCEDAYGVAVRKIHQNGKSTLRYVKCEEVHETTGSNKSVGSFVRQLSHRRKNKDSTSVSSQDVPRRVLSWGKKKDCRVPLDRFTKVAKGKTTERTKRSSQPASRLLSLITESPAFPTLDIEAPTRLDRDKFARAFAKFLQVPLEPAEYEGFSTSISVDFPSPTAAATGKKNAKSGRLSAAVSAPDTGESGAKMQRVPVVVESPDMHEKHLESQFDEMAAKASEKETFHDGGPIVSGFNPEALENDNHSGVSSLTGAGFDPEIVEELHQALTEARADLVEARAEAARAVKVAEQAIQSAENSNSKDWNSTVTHKAAEAAAAAQKRSAEAMAKARLAEERLAGEKRTAAFWRRQAEAAEEEAGVLQTRAAAAEVQRAKLAEELDSTKRSHKIRLEHLSKKMNSHDQREALDEAIQRNRTLELELDGTRHDLSNVQNEATALQDELAELNQNGMLNGRERKSKLPFLKKRRGDDKVSLLAQEDKSRENPEAISPEQVRKLHAELAAIRAQYDLLKRTTADELKALPEASQLWADQVMLALKESEAEARRLRDKLALESSTRRKLLHEVQDLRGSVRVYCRPRRARDEPVLSLPSHEILVLHKEKLAPEAAPMSFEFDRIFDPGMDQTELYDEFEDLMLGALDGYQICLMAYGQSGAGKTHTIFGDVCYQNFDDVIFDARIENHGVLLQATNQLFTIAEQRSERYQDVFSMSIVEVHDERLSDLVAGTEIAEARGKAIDTSKRMSRSRTDSEDESAFGANSSKHMKLEIRTDHDGTTVVQGLVSVEIKQFKDVVRLWQQALVQRHIRVSEQGFDVEEYEAASHVICTVKVTSTNIATGVCSVGKLQFVDLAGADLVERPPPSGTKAKNAATGVDNILAGVGNDSEWKFQHKSLGTLSEVVRAREQFARSVPYRNSTITHLLSDSLEADAKVMMIVTVSSELKDIQETACALRFANRLRKVNIGKATKHTLSHA